jgi:hypothetical protein
MKTFKEYAGGRFLLEMPHIAMSGAKVVDLELEVHGETTEQEFIDYIEQWLNGEIIQSKVRGFKMQIRKSDIKDFSDKILNNRFFRLFVIKHFDESVWNKIVKMIRNKI